MLKQPSQLEHTIASPSYLKFIYDVLQTVPQTVHGGNRQLLNVFSPKYYLHISMKTIQPSFRSVTSNLLQTVCN